MSREPLVSVVIPNYNRAGLVSETIASCLAQSLADQEIIVVDDGSTDDSIAVLRSYGSKLTLLEQTNRGPAAARNAGLRAARGRYVHFMDSDDLCSRNQLEAQVAIAEAQQADYVYGPWCKAMIDGTKLSFCDFILQSRALRNPRHILHYLSQGWSTVLQTALIRRSYLERVGNYREDMQPHEDLELLARLACAGGRLVFSPGTLMVYRNNNADKQSGSAFAKAARYRDQIQYLLTLDRLSKEHAGTMRPVHRIDFWLLVTVCGWHVGDLSVAPPRYPPALAPLAPPQWFWRFENTFLRLQTFRRKLWRLLYGTRWHPQVHARRPGPREFELVRQMGFSVVPITDRAASTKV